MDSFPDKVDFLFKTYTKEDGSEYSYREVAEGTGNALSSVYMWQLRTGRSKNPGYQVVKALSEFFGVPVGFFYDEVEKEHVENLAQTAELDIDLIQITRRARDLDAEGKRIVLDLIKYLCKKGLD